MSRKVHCVKLDKKAEGLEMPPLPNELGQRIYDNVSKEAWQQWLPQQTILINEHRLSVIDPKAQEFLQQEMEKYFFGGGSELPEGYVPPEKS